MKPLQRIAIALGVAQVALLVAAARRHAPPRRHRHDDDHPHAEHPREHDGPRAGRCGPRGRSGVGRPRRHGPGRPSHHRDHGGPPPWMRERLADWHRDQHAPEAEPGVAGVPADADRSGGDPA